MLSELPPLRRKRFFDQVTVGSLKTGIGCVGEKSQYTVRGFHLLFGERNARQQFFAYLMEITILGGHFHRTQNRA